MHGKPWTANLQQMDLIDPIVCRDGRKIDGWCWLRMLEAGVVRARLQHHQHLT